MTSNQEEFRFRKSEIPFSYGGEKRFYNDPDKPDRVIGIYKEGRYVTENEIRARYYLTKILHLLFPKNIPDIHLSTSRSNAITRDKVELGEEHDILSRNFMYYGTSSDRLPTKEEAIMARRQLRDDPKVSSLWSELFAVGLTVEAVDLAMENFGRDQEGNAKYIEVFDAFLVLRNELIPTFNSEKLEQAINGLEGEKKKQALDYFKRLQKIIAQEKKRLENGE